jgi:ferredoxin
MTQPDQMAEAMRRQFGRREESMRVDRSGWTDEQWCEDADRLMNEPDGAITSLVNGHALHLLRVWRNQKAPEKCSVCQSSMACINRRCPTKHDETGDVVADGLRLRTIEQVVGGEDDDTLGRLIQTDPLVHTLVAIGRQLENKRQVRPNE